MRWHVVVMLTLAVISGALGWHRAIPATRPSEAPGIGGDLPTLSPVPIDWGPESRYPQFLPLTEAQRQIITNLGIDVEALEGRGGETAAVEAQLKTVEAELTGINAIPPNAGLRVGAGQLVLRLSPPSKAPRAVVRLREGRLFLLAQNPDTSWSTRPLTEFRPMMIDTIDLTGDGRPEIIAGQLTGSGAFLTLQIFMWDDQQVWEIFQSRWGANEPGQYGFYDAEGDGRRELYIDTAAGHGLFRPGIHGPYLRDRIVYRFDGRSYVPGARYRFATPFYHLNRYLYFSCRGDWRQAFSHAEPGAEIDRRLAAWLGEGGLVGGDDVAFVNGRTSIQKEELTIRAEFGPTGRLLRLISSIPAKSWPEPKGCGE